MKLKKFYLRYDPPGVGIEVEHKDGPDMRTEMRHKDLPDSASSVREIETLVDDIIASQPGLLTQRRHQIALVQLLGRLYNIEVGAAADRPDEELPQKTKGSSPPADSAPELQGNWRTGQEVVLVGLEGRLQVHNGEVGKLVKVNVEKGKCEVQLNSSGDGSSPKSVGGLEEKPLLKVKGLKHILPVAAGGGPMVTGTPVVICRLRNHAELNGWPGRILEKSEEQNRYVVRAAESGQLFRVKKDNLVQVEPDALSKVGMDEAFHMEFFQQMQAMKARLDQTQSNFGAAAAKQSSSKNSAPVILPEVPGAAGGALPVGARVHLGGLRVATNFNGASAVVVTVDRAKLLYQVRLEDGSLKTVKAENIRPGPGPGTGKGTKGARAGTDVMK